LKTLLPAGLDWSFMLPFYRLKTGFISTKY